MKGEKSIWGGGGCETLARSLTLFSWGIGAGGKNVFFLLDPWGMCVRARDLCKTVGQNRKITLGNLGPVGYVDVIHSSLLSC